jgi:hypothetical protein
MDDEREKRLEERQHEREERRRERWERRRNDPIGPVIGALILIWLGVVFLAAQNSDMLRLPFEVSWNNVWALFLAGLGALLILQGILHAATGRRFGIVSSLIWGIVLLLIGLAGMFPGLGLDKLWPLAIIALGVGLLLTNLLRR